MEKINERARKICLTALEKNKSKVVVFKDQGKKNVIVRPFTEKGKPYILSYEIYKDPSKLKEQETVNTLNKLVREGVVELKFVKGWVWYCLK